MQRIVYKNYLLPPIKKPVYALQNYLKITDPSKELVERRFKISKMDERERNNLKKKMDLYNEVLLKEIEEYRIKYIYKIAKLPFYYDLLLEQVGNHAESDIKEIYEKIRQIPPKTRKQIYEFYDRQNAQFSKTKGIYRIPINIFENPKEIFSSQNEGQWDLLSESQRKSYLERWNNYVFQYNMKFNLIVLETKISKKALLQMVEEQYEKKNNFKKLLLNTH